MLIRASGVLAPELYLLTLGSSCHYLVGTPRSFYLFDPGLSVHAPMLIRRLNEFGFALRDCAGIILTHAHTERIGGVPYIRKHNPAIKLFASSQVATNLKNPTLVSALYDSNQELSSRFQLAREIKPLDTSEYLKLFTVDKALSDSEHLKLTEESDLRVINFDAHAIGSLAYLLEPINYLIGDESMGYFRGRDLPAPGFDLDIDLGVTLLTRISQMALNGICLPYQGAITAELQRKHTTNLVQCTKDLVSESKRAFEAGTPLDEIKCTVKSSLFTLESSDPLMRVALGRSFDCIWQQLEAKLTAPKSSNESQFAE